MAELSHICPKCQKSMEQGFIPDWTHGAVLQTNWVRGLPSRASFWQRLGTFKDLAISYDYKDYLKVVTYRCPECGYLESFAPD